MSRVACVKNPRLGQVPELAQALALAQVPELAQALAQVQELAQALALEREVATQLFSLALIKLAPRPDKSTALHCITLTIP